MRTGIILFTITVMMVLLSTPPMVTAQTSGKKAPVQRLYFDHRGQVDTVEGDTLVINDRTYKVLSTVTLFSMDQKPLAGLSNLKEGDFIGFTVDDEHRIDAIYLLKPPRKPKK